MKVNKKKLKDKLEIFIFSELDKFLGVTRSNI